MRRRIDGWMSSLGMSATSTQIRGLRLDVVLARFPADHARVEATENSWRTSPVVVGHDVAGVGVADRVRARPRRHRHRHRRRPVERLCGDVMTAQDRADLEPQFPALATGRQLGLPNVRTRSRRRPAGRGTTDTRIAVLDGEQGDRAEPEQLARRWRRGCPWCVRTRRRVRRPEAAGTTSASSAFRAGTRKGRPCQPAQPRPAHRGGDTDERGEHCGAGRCSPRARRPAVVRGRARAPPTSGPAPASTFGARPRPAGAAAGAPRVWVRRTAAARSVPRRRRRRELASPIRPLRGSAKAAGRLPSRATGGSVASCGGIGRARCMCAAHRHPVTA